MDWLPLRIWKTLTLGLRSCDRNCRSAFTPVIHILSIASARAQRFNQAIPAGPQ
jgi:hypothetical protein